MRDCRKDRYILEFGRQIWKAYTVSGSSEYGVKIEADAILKECMK